MSPGAGDDDGDLHRMGDVAERVARSLRGTSPRAALTVFAVWEEAAGPEVAAHAEPVSFDDGVLVVTVDQPGWATQLRYLEPQLRANLAAALGVDAVASIEVRVRRA